MKRNQTRMIVATAVSAAAIAVAVDHTRQRLPEPEERLANQEAVIIIDEGQELPVETGMECGKPVARGRRDSPCSL